MFSIGKLTKNLEKIHSRIRYASDHSGRKPEDVTLIAVTKGHSIEIIKYLKKLEIDTIGESKIQETEQKINEFNKINNLKMHLIGHLQSNKVAKAIKMYDVIQTVDSLKLATKINNICAKQSIIKHCFIQIKIIKDKNKKGITEKEALVLANQITHMNNVKLCGLMTIPPLGLQQKDIYSLYKKTRLLRNYIKKNINKSCKSLSMGMSNDFEIAINQGATHIRIGQGIFGKR